MSYFPLSFCGHLLCINITVFKPCSSYFYHHLNEISDRQDLKVERLILAHSFSEISGNCDNDAMVAIEYNRIPFNMADQVAEEAGGYQTGAHSSYSLPPLDFTY